MLTEGIKNLRLYGLLTLIAITYGKLGGLINLTQYPKPMRKNVRKIELKIFPIDGPVLCMQKRGRAAIHAVLHSKVRM